MEEKEISLLDIYLFIKKYYKLVLIFAFSAAFIAGIISKFVLSKQYESKATVMPIASKSSGMGSLLASSGLGGLVSLPGSDTGNMDIVPVMQSNGLYDSLDRKLGLKKKFKINIIDDYYSFMSAKLNVAKDLKSGLITVSFRSKEPQLNCEIVNYTLAYAKDFLQNNSITAESMNRRFIEGRLKDVKPKLELAERRLVLFQGNNKVIVPDDQGKKLVEALSSFIAEKEKLAIQRKSIEAQLNETREKSKKALETFGINVSSRMDTAIASQREKLIQKKTELELARQVYSDSHVKVILLKKEVDLLEKALKKEIDNTYKSLDDNFDPSLIGLEASRQSSLASEQAINALIDQYNEKLSKLPGVALEYTRLFREQKVLETVYMMLVQEYEKAKIDEKKEGRYFIVLNKPFPSNKKVAPKTTLNVMIAFMLGMFLAVFSGVVLETLKNLGIKNSFLDRIEIIIQA